jgi:two-component system, cell cycle response regulator
MSPGAAPGHGGQPVRVLVVDDNPLNRKLACDLLELEGYAVQACEDAVQAQALLAEGSPPDLVLMDIALPDIDGLTLTRRLKAEPRYAAMPIVAMTAFAMKGDEAKALAAGCSGYISKPIDTRQFPTQVAQALAAARPRQPLRIMVVEDHHIDMKLFGASAQLLGHLVLNNTSAEEALLSLAAGSPDVVLLDLNLPGIDGPSFLRLVRANPQTRELPVVAVTAYPDAYQRQTLLEAGCAAYLTKPVNMQALLHELEVASRAAR